MKPRVYYFPETDDIYLCEQTFFFGDLDSFVMTTAFDLFHVNSKHLEKFVLIGEL